MSIERKKVVFMGTSEFAVTILEGLLKKNIVPKAVFTRPDKPAGRKQIVSPSPVKKFSKQQKLKLFQLENLNNFSPKTNLDFCPDIIIVAAFGCILPKKILQWPQLGCINIHASLLPKLRGPSPIQAALLCGNHSTGATIILMDEGVDTGAILAKIKVGIEQRDNFPVLEKKIAKAANTILLDTIESFASGKIKPQKQSPKDATLTNQIKKADGLVDWRQSKEKILNMHRAFYIWPKCYTYFQDKKTRKKLVLNSLRFKKQYEKLALEPGFVVSKEKNLLVGTGTAPLVLEKVTLEGSRQLQAGAFVNGKSHILNSFLG